LPTQDGELVAQHQDLQIFGGIAQAAPGIPGQPSPLRAISQKAIS
jgi:hypothetical protein